MTYALFAVASVVLVAVVCAQTPPSVRTNEMAFYNAAAGRQGFVDPNTWWSWPAQCQGASNQQLSDLEARATRSAPAGASAAQVQTIIDRFCNIAPKSGLAQRLSFSECAGCHRYAVGFGVFRSLPRSGATFFRLKGVHDDGASWVSDWLLFPYVGPNSQMADGLDYAEVATVYANWPNIVSVDVLYDCAGALADGVDCTGDENNILIADGFVIKDLSLRKATVLTLRPENSASPGSNGLRANQLRSSFGRYFENIDYDMLDSDPMCQYNIRVNSADPSQTSPLCPYAVDNERNYGRVHASYFERTQHALHQYVRLHTKYYHSVYKGDPLCRDSNGADPNYDNAIGRYPYAWDSITQQAGRFHAWQGSLYDAGLNCDAHVTCSNYCWMINDNCGFAPAREMFTMNWGSATYGRVGARAEGTAGGWLPWIGLHMLMKERGGHCSALFAYSSEEPATSQIDGSAVRPVAAGAWYPRSNDSNAPHLSNGRVVYDYYSFGGPFNYPGPFANSKLYQTINPLVSGAHLEMDLFDKTQFASGTVRFILHYYSTRKVPVDQNQVFVVVDTTRYQMQLTACSSLEANGVMCTFEHDLTMDMATSGCSSYHFEAVDMEATRFFLPGSAEYGVRRFRTTSLKRTSQNGATLCQEVFAGLETVNTNMANNQYSGLDENNAVVDWSAPGNPPLLPASPPAPYSGEIASVSIDLSTVAALDVLAFEKQLLLLASQLSPPVAASRVSIVMRQAGRDPPTTFTITLTDSVAGDGSADRDATALLNALANVNFAGSCTSTCTAGPATRTPALQVVPGKGSGTSEGTPAGDLADTTILTLVVGTRDDGDILSIEKQLGEAADRVGASRSDWKISSSDGEAGQTIITFTLTTTDGSSKKLVQAIRDDIEGPDSTLTDDCVNACPVISVMVATLSGASRPVVLLAVLSMMLLILL